MPTAVQGEETQGVVAVAAGEEGAGRRCRE